MDDDIQAKMDFIVNQQAQFAANIQLHEERLTRLEGLVAQVAQVLNNAIEHFDARMARMEESHINLEESHMRLEESQRRSEEAHRRLDEKLGRLAELQAHSDRRLDALIDIIRREREDPNGKS